jgi:hypothetical protein
MSAKSTSIIDVKINTKRKINETIPIEETPRLSKAEKLQNEINVIQFTLTQMENSFAELKNEMKQMLADVINQSKLQNEHNKKTTVMLKQMKNFNEKTNQDLNHLKKHNVSQKILNNNGAVPSLCMQPKLNEGPPANLMQPTTLNRANSLDFSHLDLTTIELPFIEGATPSSDTLCGYNWDQAADFFESWNNKNHVAS